MKKWNVSDDINKHSIQDINMEKNICNYRIKNYQLILNGE